MASAISGPTLLDLQFQVQSTFEQIALVLSVSNIGYFFGSIAGGLLFDRFDNNLLLALTMVGLAVLGALVPWCPVFGVLILNCVFWGCTKACLDTGGNVYCVNLWGKESGPYMQAIHFTFALGSTIAPLIAGPFLMPQLEEHVISSALNETSTIPSTRLPSVFVSTFLPESHAVSPQDYNSTVFNEIMNDGTNGSIFPADVGDLSGAAPSLKLWIPYTIISFFNLLISLPFFCLFVTESRQVRLPNKARRNVNKSQDSARAQKKDIYFVVILLVLLCAFIMVYLGHESIYGNFLYTFAINSNLGFTPETAAYINAAYWGSFAAFRFVAIFIASKVTPKTLLTVDTIGMCISSTALAVFGNSVVEVLWVATILLGASIASAYPSCISWTERYIKLTGKAMAVFSCSASFGDTFLPWLMGYLISTFGAEVLMYTMLGVSLVTALIFFCMQTFASRHGGRYDREIPKEESAEVAFRRKKT
ncbi:sodium-dependent glucose transporter 1B-like isoform X2 [Ptychodera flava]